MNKVFEQPLVKLTFRQAVEDAKRAIREKGWTFIYDKKKDGSCQNFDSEGAPSCVVGHILSYEGMKLEDITDVVEPTFNENMDLNHLGIHTMRSRGAVQVSDEALRFLNELQILQDHGETWGHSYTAALRKVYRVRKFYV